MDTNVTVAAMISAKGVNREVLRACLPRRAQPVIGEPFFPESEEGLERSTLMAADVVCLASRRCHTTAAWLAKWDKINS